MRKRSIHALILGLVLSSPLSAALTSNEAEFSRKITSSFLIKDYERAISTCEVALKIFPESEELLSLLIRILSESGQSQKALKLYNKTLKHRDLKDMFSVIESISWGILSTDREKTEMAKLTSMIGAHLTHDVRSLQLLLESMRSSNALLRSFSVKLAGQYQDRILQKEILQLLKEEKNPFVRSQLIDTAGAMRIKAASEHLKGLIESQVATSEEIALAIQAMVRITDDVDANSLDLLLSHNRAGVRQLGVALIDHFAKTKERDRLIPLLSDPSPNVRFHVMAMLGSQPLDTQIIATISNSVKKMSQSSNCDLAIVASWLALQFDPELAIKELKKWILSEDQKAASRAASLLGAGGMHTQKLVLEAFEEVKDPYVKVNLALSLIKRNEEVSKASNYLHQFLKTNTEKLMWEKRLYPMFTTLLPSNAKHIIQIPRYPELLDQTTRLNLLNILSIVGDREIKELVKGFLQSQTWGITSTAAILLIEEGDLEAFEIVRELLTDEDDTTRLQAALVLAYYGKDPAACDVLEKAFSKASWEHKVNILEALGMIGSKSSIPFLLERMEEPFALLRTIAASSTIQCLYH